MTSRRVVKRAAKKPAKKSVKNTKSTKKTIKNSTGRPPPARRPRPAGSVDPVPVTSSPVPDVNLLAVQQVEPPPAATDPYLDGILGGRPTDEVPASADWIANDEPVEFPDVDLSGKSLDDDFDTSDSGGETDGTGGH